MLQHIDELLPLIKEWSNELAVAGVIAATITTVASVYVWDKYKHKRQETMLRKQQEKELLSDGIVEMLLELHVQEKLTAKQVNNWYIKFAKQHGLWDLHPHKLLQEPTNVVDLKDSIKQRIGGSLHRDEPMDYLSTTLVANMK